MMQGNEKKYNPKRPDLYHMKRTLLLLWLTMATLCASAQFKMTVTAGIKDCFAGEPRFVSYNLEDVCQSMGVDPEEFGHILEVWLDPYPTLNWPDEYSKYVSKKYMYLITGDGKQVVGQQHRLFYLRSDGGVAQTDEVYWECVISIDRRRNRLNFGFTPANDYSHMYGPNGSIGLMPKAGDTYHYTFGVRNLDKQATFDITINMVEGLGGNTVPLTSLEKVGEQEVRLKYQSTNFTNKTYLNLEEIAKSFGGNVKGGNLGLCLVTDPGQKTVTDRYTFKWDVWATLDETMTETGNSRDPRGMQLTYIPASGELNLYPLNDGAGFKEGEHVAGSLYLVNDGKYYELKVDEQIGEPNQHARNLAVLDDAESCGSFARSLTVSPEKRDDMHAEARTSLSLPVLAKALGADCTELTEALRYWMKGNVMEDGSEMVYNLTDYASTVYSPWGPGSFMMTKDGKAVRKGGDYTWIMEVDGPMNELQFTLWQEEGRLADGDVCHTRLGLYYEGRMVTLDLTLYLKQGRQGTQVALNSLKKVGEQTITGKITSMKRRLEAPLALDSIASLFSGGVAGKGLKLYVMENVEKGLLTDRYSYEKEPEVYLKLEGTPQNFYKSQEYFCVNYWPYHEMMFIDGNTDGLYGGQKTSASIFLVGEGEYYELLLDIQFGEETDERESFDIVATEHLSVQLMPTNNYYTYYDRVNKSYALVSTPIDEAKLAEQLGTEKPMLFAEQTGFDGSITMTSRYDCAPGQGFWFGLLGGKGCRGIFGNMEGWLGVYYTDGAFKWYEETYPSLQTGKKYTINLYMANLMQGTAVKYEIDVEIVKEIETPSIAYVHRLPQGLSATGGTNSIHNAECIMQNESGAVYDLQGRRLNAVPEKGMYIQGGRRVLIK